MIRRFGRPTALEEAQGASHVTVPDLLSTVCNGLGINLLTQNDSGIGRPISARRSQGQTDSGDSGMNSCAGVPRGIALACLRLALATPWGAQADDDPRPHGPLCGRRP